MHVDPDLTTKSMNINILSLSEINAEITHDYGFI